MGVLVDAALVHKQHHDIFKFIPVNKGAGYAGQWLSDTNYWWNRVVEAEEDGFFARNCPQACRTVYGQCDYKSICNYTTGVDDFDEAPAGYKIEKWEPFSFDELQKAVGSIPDKPLEIGE